MGGAHGPLVNVWRSRANHDYFQRWYLEKYHQRYASSTQQNTMANLYEQTTQNNRARDYHSNITVNNLLPDRQIMNEKLYDKEVKQIFGYDDTTSSVSSYSPSNETEWKTSKPRSSSSSSITSILKKPNQTSQNKHHVTIREHYPTNEINQSISTQQISNTNQHVLNEYQQVIQNHPDVHRDLNPQIITKPNPDQITYQQNISVRYLVPPTPPPPGPLIIRGKIDFSQSKHIYIVLFSRNCCTTWTFTSSIDN